MIWSRADMDGTSRNKENTSTTWFGHWEADFGKEVEFFSEGFRQILKWETKEAVQPMGTWASFFHPEDLKGLMALYQKHLETNGKVPYNMVVRNESKNGDPVQLAVQGKITEFSKEGKPQKVSVSIFHLKGHEGVQTPKPMLSNIMKAISAGEWWFVEESDRFYPSDAFWSLLGQTPEHDVLPFQDFLTQFIHSEDQDSLSNAIYRHLEDQTPLYKDVRVKRADGNYKWFRFSGKMDPGYTGSKKVFGIVQNIDSQKKVQEELGFNLKLFRESAQLAKVGGWALMSDDKGLLWSESMYEIFEKRHGEQPDFHEMVCYFKPHDQKAFLHKVDRALLQGLSFSFEAPIITERGNQKWIRSIGRVDRERGEIKGLLGAFQDITQEKEQAIELSSYADRQKIASRAASFGVWEWNLRKDELIWDSESYEIFGVQPGELKPTYRYWIRQVVEEDRPKLISCLKSAKAGTIEFREEIDILTLSKERKSVEISGLSRRNERGEVLQITGVIRDISLQKQREKALILSEEKFRASFESSGLGMILIDSKNRIVNANDSLCAMLHDRGLSGQLITNFIHTDDQSVFKEELLEILQGKRQKANLEIRFSHNGQVSMWGNLSMSAVGAENNEDSLILIQIQNITSRKHLELDLKEKNQKLKHTADRLSHQNSQLEDFNHIVSHNFRAPLANLNALLDFVEEAESEQEKEELLDRLKTTLSKLNETFDDLVEVVRIKRNKDVPKTQIRFFDVLSKVRELLQFRAQSLNAEIHCNFEVEEIYYPKIYLESIFLNLLSNALNFAGKDRRLIIKIRTYKSQGCTMLSFEDNGVGMDLEKHGYRLFKLNKSLHNKPDSKGVGLFMTKTHIESQGGEISAKSEVNKGTTFLVNFDKFENEGVEGKKKPSRLVG